MDNQGTNFSLKYLGQLRLAQGMVKTFRNSPKMNWKAMELRVIVTSANQVRGHLNNMCCFFETFCIILDHFGTETN
jgi:hypothetical protein